MASASGSRTASSPSRRRAARYPPSRRKPMATSVRPAPRRSTRNMGGIVSTGGGPVLASAPMHDSSYFEREYFQLHPGKVKYLDYLVGLLRAHGVPGGRVLDVGAGYGFFLEALERGGLRDGRPGDLRPRGGAGAAALPRAGDRAGGRGALPLPGRPFRRHHPARRHRAPPGLRPGAGELPPLPEAGGEAVRHHPQRPQPRPPAARASAGPGTRTPPTSTCSPPACCARG